MTVDLSGKYVYAVSQKSKSLTQFRVDDGGALEPLDPDTFDLPAAPSAIIADPVRPYVYVIVGRVQAAKLRPQLLVYKAGKDGILTQVMGQQLPSVANFRSFVFDADAKYLYLVGDTGEVSAGYALSDSGKDCDRLAG